MVKKLSRVEKKMRRRRAFLRFIFLIFLVFVIITLALNTELFVINKINIVGNNKLSRDSLINASTISTGENILKISKRLGEKNLAKLPYVKEAKIKRKLPKTIIIEIVERKGIAQIKSISSYLLIDIEGYILDIKDTKDEKLPLFLGLNIDNKRPGDNIFSDIKVKENIEFIKEGHAIGLLSKIKEVNLENSDNINIIIMDGIPVDFGTLNNVKYKLNLLDEVSKDIEKKQISCKMIIMNKGDNPIIVLNEE